MADWKPIETAPRDGTRVLTYGIADGHHPVNVMHWSERDEEFEDDYGSVLRAIHWQPLPPPPAETGRN